MSDQILYTVHGIKYTTKKGRPSPKIADRPVLASSAVHLGPQHSMRSKTRALSRAVYSLPPISGSSARRLGLRARGCRIAGRAAAARPPTFTRTQRRSAGRTPPAPPPARPGRAGAPRRRRNAPRGSGPRTRGQRQRTWPGIR